MKKLLAPYSKAVVAFIAPGAVLIGASVTDASPGGVHITAGEWVTAVVACIVTSAAVFSAPKNATID